jgi:hypothetical protein
MLLLPQVDRRTDWHRGDTTPELFQILRTRHPQASIEYVEEEDDDDDDGLMCDWNLVTMPGI